MDPFTGVTVFIMFKTPQWFCGLTGFQTQAAYEPENVLVCLCVELHLLAHLSQLCLIQQGN